MWLFNEDYITAKPNNTKSKNTTYPIIYIYIHTPIYTYIHPNHVLSLFKHTPIYIYKDMYACKAKDHFHP